MLTKVKMFNFNRNDRVRFAFGSFKSFEIEELMFSKFYQRSKIITRRTIQIGVGPVQFELTTGSKKGSIVYFYFATNYVIVSRRAKQTEKSLRDHPYCLTTFSYSFRRTRINRKPCPVVRTRPPRACSSSAIVYDQNMQTM